MTTSEPLPAGALVVVAWRLGRIVCEDRVGPVSGYSVQFGAEIRGEDTLPHFVADYCVKVAELDVNVELPA